MSQETAYAPGAGQSTLLSGDFPASPTALPDAVKALVMSAICGRSYDESFAKIAPDGSWEKMSRDYFQMSMELSSEPFSGTWPKWGILSDGVCGVPVTWTRLTKERESLSWPTATVHGNNNRAGISDKAGDGLSTAAKQDWPTPQARDYRSGDQIDSMRSKRKMEQGWTPGLNDVVLWATPNTMDHMPPHSPEAMRRQFEEARKGRTAPANLREQVHPECYPDSLWATPTAEPGSMTSTTGGRAPEKTTHLPAQVRIQETQSWATPNKSDGKGSHGGGADAQPTDGYTRDGRSPQPGVGGASDGFPYRLDFTGWPAGRGQEQYPWEPPRVVPGKSVTGRTSRIKMLGNAVVWQQAVPLFEAIVEMERMMAQ